MIGDDRMSWTQQSQKAAIYFEKEGEGIPLLFVHPPSMGHVTFRRQKNRLSESYQVITMDCRGNGRSGIDEQPLTMSVLADDVIRVLDEANVNSAYLCGYSNGGSIVQEAAIRYPNRVRGIILLGGFPEVNSFLLRNEFKLGILATRAKQMNVVSNVLAVAHERNQRNKRELSNYVRLTPASVLEKYYRIGLEYTATKRLHKITCPLLLMYGTRDDYVHHYRHLFTENVTGEVEVVLIDDVGHQLPTKKSSAVHEIIKTFIGTHEKNA